MLERRIRARGVAKFGKTKLVDIRIDPADLRPGTPQRVAEALQKMRLHPIVGIEEVDALERAEGREGKIDAAVAGRAEAAVAPAKIIDPVRMDGSEFAANLIGLVERTAVVNDDDAIGEIRVLGERGVEGLNEQARLLVDRNNNCDADRVERSVLFVKLREGSHEIVVAEGIALVKPRTNQ